jgi:uncharacterized protein (TIGR03086 family)
MESILDRYRRRSDHFAVLLRGVAASGWSAPSPCAGWTARDVVTHVVGMHRHVLGQLGHDASAGPDGVADSSADPADPADEFEAVCVAVGHLLADDSASATPCHTPAGPMSFESHVDEVLSDDLVVHTWDLARATGQDDTIDSGDVASLWAKVAAVPAELMARYRTPGAFGPEITVYGPEVSVSDDASAQERLVAFLGRDPGWTGLRSPR